MLSLVLVMLPLAAAAGACGSLKDAGDDPPGSSDGGPDARAADIPEGGAEAGHPEGGESEAGPSTGMGNGDPRWVQGRVPADAPAPSDFTITNGADGAVVTDKVTGVQWQDRIPGTTTSYALALSYCEDLVYDGLTDWRIPTRWEMISAMSLSTTFDESQLTNGAFSAPPGGAGQYNYWTSSAYADVSGDVWIINTAGTQSYARTDKAAVRCVRGGPLPAPKSPLYDLSDVEVVHDLTTGLYWERTPSGDATSLADATARCGLVQLAGRKARLPAVKELASLVDETRANPALDGALGAYPVRMFTTNPQWTVDFASGSLIQGPATHSYYARCVAGP
ncbi:MAG: putative secreted protein [Labilithrix sp.]|nr:putative secreted protein [Labilithrix sp.]